MGESIIISILVILALLYGIHYIAAQFKKPHGCNCEQCPVTNCIERKERL